MEFYGSFHDPVDVGNSISGSSAFSKASLNIWKFTVYILLKPGLENFKHYFASVWDECNCLLVWAFFGIAFLWDWNSSSLTIYVKQHNKYRTEPMDDINQSLPSIVSDHSLCPMWCAKCPHAQGCWGLERHIFSVILLVNNKEWIKIEIYLIYTLCPIPCPPDRITASTQAQHGALNMPANLENSAVATGLYKVNFHFNSKERNAKDCTNYCTIALISHASKRMLKTTVHELRTSRSSRWI